MSEEKQKIVTVGEFKAMIQGIDIMGGEDFTPNREQWKRIRKMIDQLEDTPQVVNQVVPARPMPTAGRPAATGPMPGPTIVADGPNPWETGAVAAPAVPGSIPSGPVTMGSSTSSLKPPQAPAQPQEEQADDGPYDTQFI